MNPRWTRPLAIALVASLFCTSSALTQITISEAPAIERGAFTCAAKFKGSFLDLLTRACWQCPPTHPHRSPFPNVAAPNACERRAQTLYRKARGPENPTGILQCRSGWFPHFDGKCYSCAGYNRTAEPNIASARACERVIPAAYTSATRKGVEGCPDGAFRNGLTAYCYSCPPDYARNAVIAEDLTKVKACSRISTAVRDATLAKYERHKNDHPESRANLARAAAPAARTTGAAVPVGPGPVARYPEDKSRQDQMVAILEDELKRNSGFVVVSWTKTAGLSILVGYTAADGYAMTKVDTSYVCRKVSSGAFTGLSVGVGASEEIGISRSALAPGRSESNGIEVGAGVGFTFTYGWHWDATTGKEALTRSVSSSGGASVSPKAKVGVEYVHTWEETGEEVVCDNMTWGRPPAST